ncbi:tyrosine-type recombinase/integrase [Streptomyces sp. NPDC057291]|uniref:tyrosine-type recombinase/integrase n=1 Tax=Streptomyces sp. NPDC057291 TaxID=3346087 RepID=UPI00362BEB4A
MILLKAWRKRQRAEWKEHKAWKYSGNRVFTREDGEAYHPQAFSDRWGRLVELSGLPPIRLHDGRHEAASLALAAGVALKAVQAMLGHASMRMTTDTYQTVLPEMHAATASASLDLIAAFRAQTKRPQRRQKRGKRRKHPRGGAKRRPDGGGGHLPHAGPLLAPLNRHRSQSRKEFRPQVDQGNNKYPGQKVRPWSFV